MDVGSAWYAWSILTFGMLLAGPSELFKALTFAVVISYMAWSYMVMLTFK